MLLPTTVIGSYPQPDWLIDRERLRSALPPRVRARELWRIPEPYLAQAQDDATAVAIAEMELAGLDGTTALHTCFGYAHVVHDRPDGYPFLAELAGCAADILAIEAAQPRLEPAALEPIAAKTLIVGVLDLSDPVAETAGQGGAR